MSLPLLPPLKPLWRSGMVFAAALAAGDRVYGITPDGRAAALRTADGVAIWSTERLYLPALGAADRQIFTFGRGEGLVSLLDQGGSASEELLLPLAGLDESSALAGPVVDGDLLYFARGAQIFAVTRTGRTLGRITLSADPPYALRLWKWRQVAAVDGRGGAHLLHLGSAGLEEVWHRPDPAAGSTPVARPLELHGGFLYTTGDHGVRAIDFGGRQVWLAPGVAAPGGLAVGPVESAPRAALAVRDGALFAAAGGIVWRLDAATGDLLWRRALIHPSTGAAADGPVGLAATTGAVYMGHLLGTIAPRPDLTAMRSRDGTLIWQAAERYAGLPLLNGPDQLIAFGGQAPVAALGRLGLQAGVQGQDLTCEPVPLRGPASAFASARVTLRLKVRATVTIRSWDEPSGPGALLVDRVPLYPGRHTFAWDARALGDRTHLARLTAEVTELDQPATYTVAAPVPVNTLPDLPGHWAAGAVELLLARGFVGGYPDLTFRPDESATRAQSAAIIARSLGLSGPSPGFRTGFSDMAGHWAERPVLALEQRGVVTGFLETGGRRTFRPDQPMTRAEEARFLTRAYSLDPAPIGFPTRFTDIAAHWARAGILALEAGGYTTGYREPDGSHTYRPDQSLTRAELSVLIVRILGPGGDWP